MVYLNSLASANPSKLNVHGKIADVMNLLSEAAK